MTNVLKAWLFATCAIVGFGCTGEDKTQVLTGRVSTQGAIAVRAIDGDTIITAARVRSDGTFTLLLPANHRYRLEVLTEGGVHNIVGTKNGSLADITFKVCQPQDPFDMGGMNEPCSMDPTQPGCGGTCDPMTDPNCGWPCDPMTDPSCGVCDMNDPTDPDCKCDPTTDPNCGGTPCDPMTDPSCGVCDPNDPMDPDCVPPCDPTTDPNCGGMCPDPTDPNCGWPPPCDPMTDPNCGTMCPDPTDPNCGWPPPCDPMTDPTCGGNCMDPTDPNCGGGGGGCMDPTDPDPNCGKCEPGDENCGEPCDPMTDVMCPTPPPPCMDPTDPNTCKDPCVVDPLACGCASDGNDGTTMDPGPTMENTCWPPPEPCTMQSCPDDPMQPQYPPGDFGCGNDDGTTMNGTDPGEGGTK